MNQPFPENEVDRYFFFDRAVGETFKNGSFRFGKLTEEQRRKCANAAKPRNVDFVVDEEGECCFVDPLIRAMKALEEK